MEENFIEQLEIFESMNDYELIESIGSFNSLFTRILAKYNSNTKIRLELTQKFSTLPTTLEKVKAIKEILKSLG